MFGETAVGVAARLAVQQNLDTAVNRHIKLILYYRENEGGRVRRGAIMRHGS